jgi:hypothetical protein
VLAYLCGHCHYDRLEAMPPGYLAHSNARAVLRNGAGTALSWGALTLYALADGHINLNTKPGYDNETTPNNAVFLVITRPAQYIETQHPGGPLKSLDHTKTPSGMVTVRAYARANGGSITQVNYRLDAGAAVIMQRIGTTAYWEATLDARELSGRHTIKVTAKGLIGAEWRPESTHQITCYFAANVPARTAPGCGSVNMSLPLAQGWNLISVPFAPTDSDLAAALSSIEGQYSEVFAYDAFDSDTPWEHHTPGAPAPLNDLTAIQPQRGYWLRMSAAATLFVAGEPLSPASIALKAGWNLVGYPSQTTRPVATALASIAGQYDVVYAYDNATPSGHWKTYNVNASPPTNDLAEMVAGEGYWIHATADCTWTLP